jgi:hypothetical protein
VKSIARIISWPQWFADIHKEPDQVKRQISALSEKLEPLSIDKDDMSRLFKGSAETSYFTTNLKCKCADFVKRKLPCKHMYRLAHHLGLIELNLSLNATEINKAWASSYRCKGPWGDWHPSVHKLNHQQARQHRAFTENITVEKVDRQENAAVVNNYQTSLDNCTCPDFQERHLPCKHIYLLARELQKFVLSSEELRKFSKLYDYSNIEPFLAIRIGDAAGHGDKTKDEEKPDPRGHPVPKS